MPMPEVGTQEYKDLVAETGGGAALPGFNYEGHIAATRNADGTTKVIETIPQTSNGSSNSGSSSQTSPAQPSSGSANNGNFTIYLTNPPAKMPSQGTAEYDQLFKETGGASANPGFSYEGHIQATRGASAGTILSSGNTTGTTPNPVSQGFSVILTSPPARMPSPGTPEYEQLLKETGGASANPGFSYEGHIQATRGDSAKWILNPDIPRPIEIDLSALVIKPPGKGDVITGTATQDLIAANKGALKLTGGADADKFIFNQRDSFGSKGADTITDFKTEDGDQLVISSDALPGLAETPVFRSVTSKKALKTAQKSDSDLIYYQPLGQLFYDQNGSKKGFGSGGLFAILAGTPDLSAEDIAIL